MMSILFAVLRSDAKKSETLVVRRGVQKWNWQFLADQPPQEIAELYLLVKVFPSPSSLFSPLLRVIRLL